MKTNDAAVIALGEAIKQESDGRAFYSEAAEKASNPFAKAVLSALADDEKDHLKRVREIYETLKNRPGWPTTSAMIARKSGALNIFEEKSEKVIESISDNDAAKVLKTSLEMENKAEKFYLDRADAASCSAEKEFYEKLAAEEALHCSIIQRLINLFSSAD